MNKIIYCCFFNLRQWRKNPRIICVFLLLFGYLFFITEPISRFCSYTNTNCNPWLFPFITSDANCVFILMVLLVILLCDAPFLYDYQKYLIIRTGKKIWIVSQIIYIAFVTFLYWLFIVLFSGLLMIPHLGLSAQWGSVISTYAQMNIGDIFQSFFAINYKILIAFEPFKALLISFLFAWLVGFFMGLVILYFNMFPRKSLGVVAAFTMILVQHFAYMASGYWVYQISPISWVSMSILNFSASHTGMPSAKYALTALLILIAGLTILIIKRMIKKSIDLME